MPVKAVQQFMLGTVLGNEAQARETLRAIRAAGYGGIELCSFMLHPMGVLIGLLTKAAGMPVGKGSKLPWRALLQEADLQVVSLHADLGAIERNALAVAAEAKHYGTSTVVVTGMYRFDYANEAAVRSLAARLNKAGAVLAKKGICFLYHNHNCELQRLSSGKTAYDVLLEETNPDYVNFEFDSYWFAQAGANPLVWMQRLGTRMKLWHIADRGPVRSNKASFTPIVKADSRELGTGAMELSALMQQAKTVGVGAVILETHRNWAEKSPVKSLQISAEFLNKHLDASTASRT